MTALRVVDVRRRRNPRVGFRVRVFPAISVSVVANGFACYDSVIDVAAKPLAAVAARHEGAGHDLMAIGPALR